MSTECELIDHSRAAKVELQGDFSGNQGLHGNTHRNNDRVLNSVTDKQLVLILVIFATWDIDVARYRSLCPMLKLTLRFKALYITLNIHQVHTF